VLFARTGYGQDQKPTAGTPTIKKAWFDKRPVWDPVNRRFENRLYVQFEPTTSPLWLIVNARYKGVSVERDIENPPVDVSQWAKEGSIWRNRWYQDAGEYTVTILLRNPAGDSAPVTLPLMEAR
jgi:hypothetical protein